MQSILVLIGGGDRDDVIMRTAHAAAIELAERWSCAGSARARGQRTRCELGCDGRLRSMAATPTRSRQSYRRFAPLHRAAHLVDALRPGGKRMRMSVHGPSETIGVNNSCGAARPRS